MTLSKAPLLSLSPFSCKMGMVVLLACRGDISTPPPPPAPESKEASISQTAAVCFPGAWEQGADSATPKLCNFGQVTCYL